MRITAIISLIGLIATSCASIDDCANSNAGELFHEHLSVVGNIEKHQALNGQEYLAVFFLEVVTGTSSTVNYGDISVYQNDKSKYSDIEKWEEWFKDNGCYLEYDELITIQSKIKMNNPWMDSEND